MRITKSNKRVAAIAVAGIFVSSLTAGARMSEAATPAEGSIDQQVVEADDDLGKASKAVQKARQELERVAARLPDAQARLAAAKQSLADATNSRDRARAALQAATAAVDAARAQAAAVQVEVDDLKTRITAMARQAYITGGGFSELDVLLSSADPAAFADALAAIQRKSRGNNEALSQAAEAQVRLLAQLAQVKQLESQAEAQRDQAIRDAAAADAAAADATTAKATVEELVSAKSTAVSTARSHRRSVRRMYEALRAEQIRIAREAAEAARRQRERENANRPPGAPPATEVPPGFWEGTLGFPIPGARVGGRTGWRVHPVYGYKSCHTGDDISASSGTPIRAAAAGTVVSTASGGPYGNHTLISHAGGLSTMYAHQSRFAVSPGTRVTRGQVIGYVGSTGYSTGPHLHFEVHVNGVPYEPMGWFGGGSKQRVSCWSG